MKLLTSSLLTSPLAGAWPSESFLQKFLALARNAERSQPHSLPLDLYENATSYVAVLEVPGARREQLHIETQGGTLQVSLDQTAQTAGSNRSQRLSRSIQLPNGHSPESISASLQDGLLRITLPKPTTPTPRSIPIQ